MLDREITFDRFIRGLIATAIIVASILLINHLSSVLLPFFIAWIIAYMIWPMVRFLQFRCHLRSRLLSIAVALLIVLAVLALTLLTIIPPTISEFAKLSHVIHDLATQYLGESRIAQNVDYYLRHYVTQNDIVQLIKQDNVQSALQSALAQVWSLVYHTMDFIIGLFGLFIILLYIFFILCDYEKLSEGWVRLIPASKRHFATQLVSDVESGMNAYFRGQALIALIVGILFAIGFTIIGLPLGIGLGLLIGLLNLVPYLQLIGFIPTILLALMKSVETGQSFWVILLSALVVFAVVQLIQDLVLTPKIMGHVMGLNPAVILLSLSVWGALLGLIGLIIALPLTTLCLSYYRRFVLKESGHRPAESAKTPEKTEEK